MRRRKRKVEPEPEPEPEVVEEPEIIAGRRGGRAAEAIPRSSSELRMRPRDSPAASPKGCRPSRGHARAAPPRRQRRRTPHAVRPRRARGPPCTRIPSRESRRSPPLDRKGKQRKRVREVVNLQEQEQFARQITGRGGQRRTPVLRPLAPRAVVNPRRKRRDKLAEARRAQARLRIASVKVEGEISVGELAKLAGRQGSPSSRAS